MGRRAGPGPVHGLFQRRVAGDDALLDLAGLRFAQMGLAAELYADTPDELGQVLRFVPPHRYLPMVHLNRGLNVLDERDRAAIGEFAARFAGRVAGLVVHDKHEMAAQTDRLLRAMSELDGLLRERPGRPRVFLEYAAGHEPGWFVEVAERLQDAEQVSCCIDIGHIGIRQASARFRRGHPGLSLKTLGPADSRLPDLAADVQSAVAGALPDVLDVIRSVGSLGKHVHFHLHDGHPLIPGLSDHFTFLTRLPVPFSYQGRRSLSMLYGPAGLASIVSAAVEACRPQAVSFTLEIHQVEGRLPLADASGLFSRWRDLTNAERMNYWLSVLGENAILVSQDLGGNR
ncbi:MAG TPA: hypothetical protein VMI33_10475 [Streptosporangiaceae bacterium]|nr:hypothetical protein [Streptosporangiaceae bacterium]